MLNHLGNILITGMCPSSVIEAIVQFACEVVKKGMLLHTCTCTCIACHSNIKCMYMST